MWFVYDQFSTSESINLPTIPMFQRDSSRQPSFLRRPSLWGGVVTTNRPWRCWSTRGERFRTRGPTVRGLARARPGNSSRACPSTYSKSTWVPLVSPAQPWTSSMLTLRPSTWEEFSRCFQSPGLSSWSPSSCWAPSEGHLTRGGWGEYRGVWPRQSYSDTSTLGWVVYILSKALTSLTIGHSRLPVPVDSL